MGCYYLFYTCKETFPSLTDEKIQRGIKKRELDELQNQYTQEKGYNVNKMYECDCWKVYKTVLLLNSICTNLSPTKCLSEKKVFEDVKSESLFGYVQCDNEIPQNLGEGVANFSPIFNNNNVGRDDIGPFMKEYAKKEGV